MALLFIVKEIQAMEIEFEHASSDKDEVEEESIFFHLARFPLEPSRLGR